MLSEPYSSTQNLPHRPFGCRMGLSTRSPTRTAQDREDACHLLAGPGPLMPRLKKIWMDGSYSSNELAKWCEQHGGWELEIVERDREAEGFEVLPKRWIVERTFE